jgi:hypothetical protein
LCYRRSALRLALFHTLHSSRVALAHTRMQASVASLTLVVQCPQPRHSVSSLVLSKHTTIDSELSETSVRYRTSHSFQCAPCGGIPPAGRPSISCETLFYSRFMSSVKVLRLELGILIPSKMLHLIKLNATFWTVSLISYRCRPCRTVVLRGIVD